MKIVIKTKNIKLTQSLRDFIQEKFDSLEKFLKIFQDEKYYNGFFGKGKPRVEAWVEVERESLHHKKGEVFRAECQLRFPGKSIRSEAISKNLRQAINKVKDELQREFKQYKEKIISQNKRKTRVLKKELKISSTARSYRKGRIREEGI
jgi:ribosomal subunit interface protein